MFNKSGVISVVTVVLLLGVGVVFTLGLFVWTNDNFSLFLTENEAVGNVGDLEILGIKSSGDYAAVLGVRNRGTADHQIKTIKVGNQECNVVNEKIVGNVNNLELDCDVSKLDNYEVSIISDKGVFSSFATVWDESEKEVILPFRISFDFGSVCDNSTKIYGMNYTNNSHAEIFSQNNYFYSACITHENYTISNDCSGNFVKLFSLAGPTNSPIYLNSSLAAPEPFANYYDWQDVCLSSSGGSWDVRFQSNRPTRDEGFFICVASFVRDDYNGGHVGGCGQYSDKLWVALEE